MQSSAIRSVTRRLPVLTFFAALLLPVALLGFDGPWLGPGNISVRGKAPFPSKFTPGSFRDFDEWFADRIGLRYPLIYAGTELHVGVLRRPLDRHIFFGRDGWMFWTDDQETIPATMADSRGKLAFSATEIGRIDAQLRAIHDRFQACNIPSIVIVIPNKQSIYGEYLFGKDTKAPPNRLDRLLSGLSEPAKAMILDSRPRMRAAKLAHAPVTLYPKTETHWNLLGAFYGYVEIMSALARQIPISHRELLSIDQYRVTSTPYAGGDMATRVLFSPWRFPDEYVSVTPKIPIAGYQKIEVDHEHTLYLNPQGQGRLVLFGDSYAHDLMPFLAQHFAEVHRVTGDVFYGDIAAQLRPTAVVLEMVERYAARLLKPQIRLDKLCDRYQPGL